VGLIHVHGSYGKLVACFWIITVFMVVEVVCGWLFGSLTLMSDGFHMLSDSVSLGLSALAVLWASKKATGAKTYGFKRLEILAAFGNGLTLVLLSGFICIQGVKRLLEPVAVEARSMLGVAVLGLLVNLFVAWWLHRGGREKTVNEDGVFWHVMGDLGASLAAVAAATAILAKGWIWMDPLLSLVIAGAISLAGLRVMRRSGHILVEGTPEGVELEAVRTSMLADKRVRKVHDLHMWTMNGRDLYLSAHVETEPGEGIEQEVTTALTRALSAEFHVDHITLQVGHCVGEDCFSNCETPARDGLRADSPGLSGSGRPAA
jgi:cobalt-zinc-cadmium efflux system protein